MATTYYNDIQKLYVAYFNRPADPAGLAFWETAVEAAKGDTAAVSAAFAGSAEYKAAYANMTNAQIVDAVYQNLFGRPAEDAGKAYWADLLDKKTVTIDKVVTDVAAGAQGTDKTAYANKVTAAAAFTAAVDTDAEKTGYNGDAANKLAKTFLAGVTTDATLSAAIAPAALNTTIAKVVEAGTPFTLTGALASYDAANKAVATFLDAADGTADGKITPDEAGVRAKIAGDVSAAETKIDGQVGGAAYVGASAGVKSALIADQVSANATKLANDQQKVSDANADIAKVAGLSTAIATLASATTASDNADKAVLAAKADLNAKLASYNTLHTTALTVGDDGTVAGLIELKDGKLQLVSGVTEDKNAGVTALLNSSTTKEAADASATKAATAEASAQAQVDYLDMSADEKTDLTAIKALMKDVTVADGSLPTLAQITTQQSILDTKAAAAGATPAEKQAALDFKAAVTTYQGDAAQNDLVAKLKLATDAVTADQNAIKALADAVAALNKAQASADQLTALDATVTAAGKVFTSHDLALPLTVTGATLASAGSDIFVAGKTDASISLFGLLGTDSLYIGKDYVLNTGKLSAGSDAALEAFVAQSGSDTTIKLEQHNFSSHVTGTPASEIVTITLVGVNATDVHLNNGIITVGTTA
jgi:hypothetical protein